MADRIGGGNGRVRRDGTGVERAWTSGGRVTWAACLGAWSVSLGAVAQPAPAAAPPDVAGAAALLKLFSADANPKLLPASAYLNVRTTGERTQLVRMSGAIYDSAEGPLREVYSFAVKLGGPLDPNLALRLLKESDAMLPKGAWVIVTTGDGANWIEFEDFVPSNAAAGVVQNVVTRAALTADKLEAELTGKDEQ